MQITIEIKELTCCIFYISTTSFESVGCLELAIWYILLRDTRKDFHTAVIHLFYAEKCVIVIVIMKCSN